MEILVHLGMKCTLINHYHVYGSDALNFFQTQIDHCAIKLGDDVIQNLDELQKSKCEPKALSIVKDM